VRIKDLNRKEREDGAKVAKKKSKNNFEFHKTQEIG